MVATTNPTRVLSEMAQLKLCQISTISVVSMCSPTKEAHLVQTCAENGHAIRRCDVTSPCPLQRTKSSDPATLSFECCPKLKLHLLQPTISKSLLWVDNAPSRFCDYGLAFLPPSMRKLYNECIEKRPEEVHLQIGRSQWRLLGVTPINKDSYLIC